MTEQPGIGAIILAGGQSTRMGRDKGMISLHGKPMTEWVIGAVQALTSDIIIVANRPEYNRFGYPVVPDEITGRGPLSGLLTGLKNSRHHANFVLSCDIPFITTEILSFLYRHHTRKDITVIGSDEKIHPLIGIYTKTCLPVIEEHIRSDQLRMTDLLTRLNAQIVPATGFDPRIFRNINSIADL